MNPPKKMPNWITSELSKKVTFLDQTETFPSKYNLPNTNSNAANYYKQYTKSFRTLYLF